MHELTIALIIMVIGVIITFIGISLEYEYYVGLFVILGGLGVTVIAVAVCLRLLFRSQNDMSELLKEIENKEIISIEMDDSGSVFHDSTHRYIDSIVYIDDDGIKTKIDCSNRILSPAEIEESTDKKYHITIIEDKDITVYMPESKEYTTK